MSLDDRPAKSKDIANRARYCAEHGIDACIDRFKESGSIEDLYKDYYKETHPDYDKMIENARKADKENNYVKKLIMKQMLKSMIRNDRTASPDTTKYTKKP
jgi:acyl CoA:acetate/3-ketoacid CoA transferase